MTMPSIDMTLMQNKLSFVDHVPYLLREKVELFPWMNSLKYFNTCFKD